MKEKIWLSSPHMGGNEQKYIQDAFAENWIAPLGPNVSGFEQDLQGYLGQEVEVAVLSSGTAALHLALIALGVGRGDEVICQTLTFAASANPIVYLGASPVFVDSEPDTLNICPEYLEKAIKDRISKGKKPKAIIAVHLYGMPYKVKEVHAVAEKYEIQVIEDSAEALGSSYDGRKCGTFGEYGILSFNGNKIITTSGGGALVCKTGTQKKRAIFLATQAKDDAPHYQHSEIGYNYRMSNICAGIGRGQMEVLDDHVLSRREMNSFYRTILAPVPGVNMLSDYEGAYSNHWLSVIFFDSSKTSLTSEMLKSAFDEENIESRPLWKPMHLQPVFADAHYVGAMVAEDAFRNGLCLPSGSNLSEEHKERIAKVLSGFFKLKDSLV